MICNVEWFKTDGRSHAGVLAGDDHMLVVGKEKKKAP